MCWRRIWIFLLCCSRNGTTGTLVDLPDWEPDIVIFSFSLKPKLFANTVAAIFYDGKCIAENQIKIMNNGWNGKGDGVGFKASVFNIQELRTAIRQVIMLWFIPEEIQISLSQWNVKYESYEWIWNSISRQGPMFCRLPWPTLSQLHANENPLLRRFLIFYIHVTTSPPSFFTKWWDLQHSK